MNCKIPLANPPKVVYNSSCSHGVRAIHPPVAKLDIAVDSDSKGRGFESLRAGHEKDLTLLRQVFFNEINPLRDLRNTRCV